ncbi:hypothetical protein [Novosphingobium sp.]|uniref:hypothetical protein n=1 Tax=Novosphingobium sp. TaxID=1874826 RepID=UPI003B51A173
MSSSSTDLPQDPGARLLKGLVLELLRRLEDPAIASEMSASEMELIRKLCSDNTVTLASIRKGDFGKLAQSVEEEYPFPEGPLRIVK